MFLFFLPSIVFWTVAGGLHLLGANKQHNGKIQIKDMILSQIRVDLFQITTASSKYLTTKNHLVFRPGLVLCMLLCIYVWEYWFHRCCHKFTILFQHVHKKHHNLVPIHTLGSYYNSWLETAITGFVLASGDFILESSLCELGLAGALATFLTILDHGPHANKRHEVHHSYLKCEFS